jgi:hypothetical protein
MKGKQWENILMDPLVIIPKIWTWDHNTTGKGSPILQNSNKPIIG